MTAKETLRGVLFVLASVGLLAAATVLVYLVRGAPAAVYFGVAMGFATVVGILAGVILLRRRTIR
jgi:hypothetical protein